MHVPTKCTTALDQLAVQHSTQTRMKRYGFVRQFNPIDAVHEVVEALQERLAGPVGLDVVLCKCCDEFPSLSPEEVVQILDMWVYDMKIMKYEELASENDELMMIHVSIREEFIESQGQPKQGRPL